MELRWEINGTLRLIAKTQALRWGLWVGEAQPRRSALIRLASCRLRSTFSRSREKGEGEIITLTPLPTTDKAVACRRSPVP